MDDGMGESSDPELAGGGLDHPPPTKPEEGPVIKGSREQVTRRAKHS